MAHNFDDLHMQAARILLDMPQRFDDCPAGIRNWFRDAFENVPGAEAGAMGAGQAAERVLQFKLDFLRRREAVVAWYAGTVRNSILNSNLSASEIFVLAGEAWAELRLYSGMTSKVIETGGGCKAYHFEISGSREVWLTDVGGCSLPSLDGPVSIGIRENGEELAVIDAHNPLVYVVEFVKAMGGRE